MIGPLLGTRRAWISIAAALVAVVTIATVRISGGHPLDGWTPPATAGLTPAHVIEVIDGDSLVLLIDGRERRVNLLGANTADLVPGARNPKPYARAAAMFLRNLLTGERVYIARDEAAADGLGRELVYVFRDPDMLFVNLELLLQGYARLPASVRVDDAPALLHLDRLRAAEAHARTIEKGIWGADRSPLGDADDVAKPAPEPVRVVVTDDPAVDDTDPAALLDWVWVTRSGKKYHLENCPHLTDSAQRVTRESAGVGHEACKTCRPDG